MTKYRALWLSRYHTAPIFVLSIRYRWWNPALVAAKSFAGQRRACAMQMMCRIENTLRMVPQHGQTTEFQEKFRRVEGVGLTAEGS
jgi:hypothetical protein